MLPLITPPVTSLPVSISQMRTVLSREAVTTCLSSGVNAALNTQFECPLKVCTSCPLSASHTRAVISPDAVTTCRPLELKAMLQTGPVCPLSAVIALVSTFQM